MLGLIENLFYLWIGGVIYGSAIELFSETDDFWDPWETALFIILWPFTVVYFNFKGDE